MGSRRPVIEKLVSIPPFWRLVLSLLVAGSLLVVWMFAFVHNWLVSASDLPVALHSPLSADYSPDAIARIPAARINLLSDAISDQVREGNNNPSEQLATLVDQMRTPVFTATPFPGQTTTPRPQPTLGNAQLVSTQTPAAPSPTMPAPTASASATVLVPSATPTATVWFINVTATPGVFIPSQTPAPIKTSKPAETTAPTQIPQPTDPPVPASPTPVYIPPTQTSIPPTATWPPPPPTNTPVTPVPYPPPGTDYP